MISDILTWANPALSALLNGCYQGVLLAGGLWLAAPFLRRANAATRYALWLAALFVVASLPVAHLMVARLPQTPPAGSSFETSQVLNVPGALEPNELVRVPRATLASIEAIQNPVRRFERLAPDSTPEGAMRPEAWKKPILEAARSLRHWLTLHWAWKSAMPVWASVALFTGWIFIVTARLLKLGLGWRALIRMQRQAVAAPEKMRARFDSIRVGLGVRRPVRLRLSSALASPVAAGFFRPAVLLPLALAESMDIDRFDQVIRHELAHLRRGDDWTNLAQQIIKAFLFFHPGVWWLSERLDSDREVACDDHVLAVTPRRESYALFLTELAGQLGGQSSVLAPAAWTTKTKIEERINMILDKSRDTSTKTARVKTGALAFTLLLAAAGAFQLGPRLALAQESPDAPRDLPALPAAGLPVAPVTAARASLAENALPADPPRAARARAPRSQVAAAVQLGALETIRIHSDDERTLTASSDDDPNVSENKSAREPRRVLEIRKRGPDGGMEERLARLEKLVETLLAQTQSDRAKNDAGRSRGLANPPVPTAPETSPAPKRRSEYLRKEEIQFEYDFKLHEDAAKAQAEDARRQLSQRRRQLEAELEGVRRALEKLEREPAPLPPPKPGSPHTSEDKERKF